MFTLFDCSANDYDYAKQCCVHVSQMDKIRNTVGTDPPAVPDTLHNDRITALIVVL